MSFGLNEGSGLGGFGAFWGDLGCLNGSSVFGGAFGAF